MNIQTYQNEDVCEILHLDRLLKNHIVISEDIISLCANLLQLERKLLQHKDLLIGIYW